MTLISIGNFLILIYMQNLRTHSETARYWVTYCDAQFRAFIMKFQKTEKISSAEWQNIQNCSLLGVVGFIFSESWRMGTWTWSVKWVRKIKNTLVQKNKQRPRLNTWTFRTSNGAKQSSVQEFDLLVFSFQLFLGGEYSSWFQWF